MYGGSPLGFAAFTTVSAFCNAGFMLGRAGAAPLAGSGAPVALNLLVLHGNVLFPVLLRWVVALLSAASDKRSSRKANTIGHAIAARLMTIDTLESWVSMSRATAGSKKAESTPHDLDDISLVMAAPDDRALAQLGKKPPRSPLERKASLQAMVRASQIEAVAELDQRV